MSLLRKRSLINHISVLIHFCPLVWNGWNFCGLCSAAAPPVPPKRRRSLPSRFRRGRIGAPLASQETLSSSFCSDIIFLDDQSSSCHAELDDDDNEDVPDDFEVDDDHSAFEPTPSPSPIPNPIIGAKHSI